MLPHSGKASIKFRRYNGLIVLYNVTNTDVTLSFKVKSFLKVVKKRVKKYPMSKNETFFVRLFGLLICMVPLYGEITVGLLTSIENNSKMKLLYKNIPVPCEPFGVIPLEKMILSGVNLQECKNAIDTYYKAHPRDKNFARDYLHIQQSYHFETIKGGCVLYANGTETYSEMLLRMGLAVIDPAFDNTEWNGKLKRSRQGAQMQKSGLYDTQIRAFCIKEEN